MGLLLGFAILGFRCLLWFVRWCLLVGWLLFVGLMYWLLRLLCYLLCLCGLGSCCLFEFASIVVFVSLDILVTDVFGYFDVFAVDLLVLLVDLCVCWVMWFCYCLFYAWCCCLMLFLLCSLLIALLNSFVLICVLFIVIRYLVCFICWSSCFVRVCGDLVFAGIIVVTDCVFSLWLFIVYFWVEFGWLRVVILRWLIGLICVLVLIVLLSACDVGCCFGLVFCFSCVLLFLYV